MNQKVNSIDILFFYYKYQAKLMCFLFFSIPCTSSIISPSISPCRYYLTFIIFSLMTVSTWRMKLLVPSYDHSPSRNAIWFRFITSRDKFDILFNKFLLKANANSPFATFFTLISSSVSLIFYFKIYMIPLYWCWIFKISFSASLRTELVYPSL